MSPSAAALNATPSPAPGFWQRRVLTPIRSLLAQGVTPDRLALTCAVGTACSLFPFLGFTSLLNLGVGLLLRFNQPLLQILNQLLGPLQVLLILVHVRIGEWLWRVEPQSFAITDLVRTFHDATVAEFFARFGVAGLHALTAWLALSPFLIAALFFTLRPALRRAARRA